MSGAGVLRVTIGERLGLLPKKRTITQPLPSTESPAPLWVEPERVSVIRLDGCPSSEYVPPYESYEMTEDRGPARVRGEMVWLHKTAPTLVIEGRPGISPDDHAAGRRR